jgi:transcriptional regulator with XRE-family HTH domain
MATAQEYLKRIRAVPMTQEEVSRRTGIPQGTVSKIERAKVSDVLSTTYLALKGLHDELFPDSATPSWDGQERRKEARA